MSTRQECPFCAEEIQDKAVKCKHCGEFLDRKIAKRLKEDGSLPWYFRTSFIIFTFLFVGPLALPLIWFRPKLPLGLKIFFSAIIIALSIFFYIVTVRSVEVLEEYYGLFDQL